MKITTESGTVYELEGQRIRRVAGEDRGMRRDEEWLDLKRATIPVVGEPMFFLVEPLNPLAIATLRMTTHVVSIE